ncbi:MAG: DUF1232 domain-containing protein [Drouetiella hepatica Uher 2000/2452]|jgi:uncharacterized membrane protein YkvA (DUF1232 family)|uniref:DUF1232 domain-containing protein n=1 Tax=Drouetiella hepatica Uher 2000/2452 TaxID=904376 RepID=A0A951UMK8_9CYAN|nr:DUF1232 domain-containing protein [Drouetiella hepatica Uher 2000/2452]
MKFYDWFRQSIRNPKYRWWILGGAAVYLISPIDISPDFIPFIGQIDDVVVMTLVVSEISQMLLDRVKANKDKKSGTVSAQAASPVDTADSIPVDVKAVQID